MRSQTLLIFRSQTPDEFRKTEEIRSPPLCLVEDQTYPQFSHLMASLLKTEMNCLQNHQTFLLASIIIVPSL